MKVLTINRCITSNFGDAAISYCMTSLLLENGCVVDNLDLLQGYKNRKPFTKAIDMNELHCYYRSTTKEKANGLFHKTSYIIRVLFSRIKMLFKRYDLVIIGGGQIINSNKKFPVALYRWVRWIKFFRISKRIVVFGVGASSTFDNKSQYYFSKAFKHIDSFYLRDSESISTLKRKFSINADYVPDVAFSIKRFLKINIDKQTDGDNPIAIGLTNFSRHKRYQFHSTIEEYISYWKSLIYGYSKNHPIKLVYNDFSDYNAIQEFISNASISLSNYEFLVLQDFTDLIKEISTSSLVVSTRMHALILAMVYGVPIHPILLSPKIVSFNEEYVNSHKNVVDFENVIKATVKRVLNR